MNAHGFINYELEFDQSNPYITTLNMIFSVTWYFMFYDNFLGSTYYE